MPPRTRGRTKSAPTPGPWSIRLEIAPGLEEVLLEELKELGFDGTVDVGGIELRLDAAGLLRVQRESRIASRATARLGTVGAPSLEILHDRVTKLPWKSYVQPRQPLDVKATVARSRLRHRERVQDKVTLAVQDALRGPRLPGGRPPHEPARIGVRLELDKATLRIDASGDLLHRRGWRKDTGRAPLRENLAAAVLRAAGWRPGEPLVDGMTGSGTFAIEAASWTLGHSPGSHRRFACEMWPCWPSPHLPATTPPPDAGASIIGADRSDKAIQIARSNADRARVARRIKLIETPIEDLEPPAVSGLLVLNPPWGGRMGDTDQVARLHARWAARLRAHWPGWRVAALVPDKSWAERAWGEGARDVARFSSGGTRIVLWVRDPARPR